MRCCLGSRLVGLRGVVCGLVIAGIAASVTAMFTAGAEEQSPAKPAAKFTAKPAAKFTAKPAAKFAAKPAAKHPAHPPEKTLWPKLEEVRKAAEKHFKTLANYEPGDILSRGDVEPIFKHLEQLGWKVSDHKQIVEQVLPDNAFLIRQVRSAAGRKFMRQVGKLQQGYDRLDHLSRLSDAETLIPRLVNGVDGYKMIEYLVEAPGGETMGRMLTNVPNGQNFNRPTGKIYTQQEFIARLKQSHTAEEKHRAEAAKLKSNPKQRR
jgi:hypothetical protein